MKPERELLLAYDDPLQVTAAFNRNLLRRINDELGGTFDLDAFAHRAVWNARESRVEMHLVSRRRQTVRIAAADCRCRASRRASDLDRELLQVRAGTACSPRARAAGFRAARQWIDEGGASRSPSLTTTCQRD